MFFKSSMSENFKKYILGSVKKKPDTKPILIASLIGGLGILGIYSYIKIRKKTNEDNIN